jgi:hypothetical protein
MTSRTGHVASHVIEEEDNMRTAFGACLCAMLLFASACSKKEMAQPVSLPQASPAPQTAEANDTSKAGPLLREKSAADPPRQPEGSRENATLKPSFTGDSAGLRQTVIVPTLDTPLPAGKNAIWCASFQLAWNRLSKDTLKDPIQVKNAEAVAERLNQAQLSEKDLPPGTFYAAAGVAGEAIPRIQR